MPRRNCITGPDDVRLIRRTRLERYPHLGPTKAAACLSYYFPQLKPRTIEDIITRKSWKDVE